MFTSFTQSPYYIRCCARCSNTNHCIFFCYIMFFQLFPTTLHVIFGFLNRITKCCITSCDKPYNQRIRHPESRRYFRSIQHTQTTACTCSHIKNASALLHSRNNLGNQFFNSRNRFFNCQCYLLIFFIYIYKKFVYRFLFQIVIQ